MFMATFFKDSGWLAEKSSRLLLDFLAARARGEDAGAFRLREVAESITNSSVKGVSPMSITVGLKKGISHVCIRATDAIRVDADSLPAVRRPWSRFDGDRQVATLPRNYEWLALSTIRLHREL